MERQNTTNYLNKSELTLENIKPDPSIHEFDIFETLGYEQFGIIIGDDHRTNSIFAAELALVAKNKHTLKFRSLRHTNKYDVVSKKEFDAVNLITYRSCSYMYSFFKEYFPLYTDYYPGDVNFYYETNITDYSTINTDQDCLRYFDQPKELVIFDLPLFKSCTGEELKTYYDATKFINSLPKKFAKDEFSDTRPTILITVNEREINQSVLQGLLDNCTWMANSVGKIFKHDQLSYHAEIYAKKDGMLHREFEEIF